MDKYYIKEVEIIKKNYVGKKIINNGIAQSKRYWKHTFRRSEKKIKENNKIE